jgi:putative endonuclease
VVARGDKVVARDDKVVARDDKVVARDDKKIHMIQKNCYVYILASQRNGTLYVGITSNLSKRIWEHKNHVVKGFTADYNVNQLVYYEIHNDINVAIQREKTLKGWRRKWKLELIEMKNPDWKDLYNEVI